LYHSQGERSSISGRRYYYVVPTEPLKNWLKVLLANERILPGLTYELTIWTISGRYFSVDTLSSWQLLEGGGKQT
jgi:hypothetical protein